VWGVLITTVILGECINLGRFWWDYGRLLFYSGNLLVGSLFLIHCLVGNSVSRFYSLSFVLFTVVTLLDLGQFACSCSCVSVACSSHAVAVVVTWQCVTVRVFGQ
jgi:hypothetical protein